MEIIGPVQIAPMFLGLPSTYINVYGAKSPVFYIKESATAPVSSRNFDLEELFIFNMIPLIQNENFENSTALGDVYTQSIVHYKIGVLPLGQQARVTFYFRTPPGFQNKVQIFEGTVLKSEYLTPLVYEWWEGSRSILVTGDGKTNISVYFRPARYGGAYSPALFFTGAETELI